MPEVAHCVPDLPPLSLLVRIWEQESPTFHALDLRDGNGVALLHLRNELRLLDLPPVKIRK